MYKFHMYKLRRLIRDGRISSEEMDLIGSDLYTSDDDFFAMLRELSYDTDDKLTRPIPISKLTQFREAATSLLRKINAESVEAFPVELIEPTTSELLARLIERIGFDPKRLDVFGDGSCIANETFDGEINYLAVTGRYRFDVGESGSSLWMDADSYTEIDTQSQSASISIVAYLPFNGDLIFIADSLTSLCIENGELFAGALPVAKITPCTWTHILFNIDKSGYIRNLHIGCTKIETAIPIGRPHESIQIQIKTQALLDRLRVFNRTLSDVEMAYLQKERFVAIRNSDAGATPIYQRPYLSAFFTTDAHVFATSPIRYKHDPQLLTDERLECAYFDGDDLYDFDGGSELAAKIIASGSMWLKLATTDTAVAILVQQNEPGWTALEITFGSGGVTFGGREGDRRNYSYTTFWRSPMAIPVGEWFHLAWTTENGKYEIYINGIKVGEFSASVWVPPQSYRQTTGAFINSSDERDIRAQFRGYMARLYIPNTPMTKEEIIAQAKDPLIGHKRKPVNILGDGSVFVAGDFEDGNIERVRHIGPSNTGTVFPSIFAWKKRALRNTRFDRRDNIRVIDEQMPNLENFTLFAWVLRHADHPSSSGGAVITYRSGKNQGNCGNAKMTISISNWGQQSVTASVIDSDSIPCGSEGHKHVDIAMPAHTWKSVAAVKRGKDIALYVDGALIGTHSSGSTAFSDVPHELLLLSSNGSKFDNDVAPAATIGEYYAFSRDLSDDEVALLHNMTKERYNA